MSKTVPKQMSKSKSCTFKKPHFEAPAQIKIELPKNSANQPTPVDFATKTVVENSSMMFSISRPSSQILDIQTTDGTHQSVAFQVRSQTPRPITPPPKAFMKTEEIRKEFYTIDEILALKPSVQPSEKLCSPGFVILAQCYQSEKEGSKQYFRPQNQAKKSQPRSHKAELVSHSNNRFISTKYMEKAGLFDPDSVENKKNSVRRMLNRLSRFNIDSIASQIKLASLPLREIVPILLERTRGESDFPERDTQLYLFIYLATILFKDNNKILVESLMEMVNQQTDSSDINTFIYISVWIASLFTQKIVDEDTFYHFLHSTIEKQPVDRSIDVLRCALNVCGARCETEKFNVFFDFLTKNMPPKGYKRFLVETLFELKKNKWEQKPEEKKSLIIEYAKKQPKIVKPDVDLIEAFNESYRQFDASKGDFFRPPECKLEELVSVSISQLYKHYNDINEFSSFLSGCFYGRKLEAVESALKSGIENFRQIVSDEDDFQLWILLFVFFAYLYMDEAINWNMIVDSFGKTMPDIPEPIQVRCIERMADVGRFQKDEAKMLLDLLVSKSNNKGALLSAVNGLFDGDPFEI